jgi:hypothetical protein
MNTKRNRCLILFAIIAMIFMLFVVATTIGARLAIRKYNKCDHYALLAACREMLSHGMSFTNSPNFRPPHSWEGTTITLTRDPSGYGPDIPLVIRELNPRYLVIRDDSIIIVDPPSFPAMRRGIIAFAPDAEKQYGTRNYIDGLWFWNGDFQSEEMRNQVYGIETPKIRRPTSGPRLPATRCRSPAP